MRDVTPPLVAIITLNWNRRADTLAFLASCAALRYPRLHTIVVDNDSSDGSREAIGAAFPAVEQLHNAANVGFARGMNVGMRRAYACGADYFFLANSDTTLAPDALDLLVVAAETYGAGLVAPAIKRLLRYNPQFCGYPPEQVALLSDAAASRDSVLAALDTLAAHAGEDATVVVFYAGHGEYGDDVTTMAVGCFPRGATPEGVLDLAGNVWEWTRSEYRAYPYNPIDGREDGREPAREWFTLRGGSWTVLPIHLRMATRTLDRPDLRDQDVGFRLARHPKV
jgi:glycosyltransferase involved in cell wall biosynthesis